MESRSSAEEVGLGLELVGQLEACVGQHSAYALAVAQPGHEVDVGVAPGNLTEQEIDGPAASQPEAYTVLRETVGQERQD